MEQINKYVLPITVLVVVAAGVVFGMNYVSLPHQQTAVVEELLSGKYSVQDEDANSFGNLADVQLTTKNTAPEANREVAANSAGGTDKVAAPAVGIGGGGGGIGIMPPEPYPDGYKFVYKGEALSELSDVVGVYKRVAPEQPQGFFEKIISIISFGLLDLSQFQNTKIQSLSFSEDKDFGYESYVDFVNGNINISQNWQKWPQVQPQCYENNCPAPEQLKLEDMPEDEVVLNSASDFLKKYRVSTEGYGKPRFGYMNDWRILYEQATDKSSFYFPENIQVVYPLMIDNREVVNEDGNPAGITLNFDVRTGKITSLYDLMTRSYSRSKYTGVTDTKRIIETAEHGGFRNYFYDNPEAKNVATIELGTPSIQIVRLWYSADYNRPSSELFVPALIFPITNGDKYYYWRKSIMIPLVQEILDQDNSDYPLPMPVDSVPPVESTGGMSAGSAQ